MGVTSAPTLVFYQAGKEVLRTVDLNWLLVCERSSGTGCELT